MWSFPLFPEQASTIARQIDLLYYALLTIAIFFTAIIFLGLTFFAIRYREGSKASRANARSDHFPLELAWTIVPLFLSFGIFAWAAKLYFDMHVAPADAAEIYVVGKQWMWKIQHPQGNREINELHMPVGRSIKLVMTSQDVIHSFYVPAFRVKQDVLPGRYSTLWFEATKIGEYHLFCAEYCGMSHASMIGKVIVMDPASYEQWLAGATTGLPMATTGEQLFKQFGCQTCHKQDDETRGPSLYGLFGKVVKLQTGERLIADQEYIRESILDPTAKITAGFKPTMPTFKHQITPEQVSQLIEYIKTLGGKQTAAKGGQQ